MKCSRRKKANRYMSFFKTHFGFREPYQLLIDGPFCLAALQNKVKIREQMASYFGCELKLLTSQCVILEMEKLGPGMYGALNVVKQFPVHKCGHEKEPIPASQCLQSMIASNNPNRYIITSQDPSMREAAREIPGTPILYLHGRAPTLEKPSNFSEFTAHQIIDKKAKKAETQLEKLRRLKAEQLGEKTQEPFLRKKKAKGPNPLSCKKKKTNTSSSTSKTGVKRPAEESTSDELVQAPAAKKKRKRVKIASHVIQELSRQQQLRSNSDS